MTLLYASVFSGGLLSSDLPMRFFLTGAFLVVSFVEMKGDALIGR